MNAYSDIHSVCPFDDAIHNLILEGLVIANFGQKIGIGKVVRACFDIICNIHIRCSNVNGSIMLGIKNAAELVSGSDDEMAFWLEGFEFLKDSHPSPVWTFVQAINDKEYFGVIASYSKQCFVVLCTIWQASSSFVALT